MCACIYTKRMKFLFNGKLENSVFIFFSIYGTMVSLFFLVQVANNAAYSFNISMPLQMVFRAVSIECHANIPIFQHLHSNGGILLCSTSCQ